MSMDFTTIQKQALIRTLTSGRNRFKCPSIIPGNPNKKTRYKTISNAIMLYAAISLPVLSIRSAVRTQLHAKMIRTNLATCPTIVLTPIVTRIVALKAGSLTPQIV